MARNKLTPRPVKKPSRLRIRLKLALQGWRLCDVSDQADVTLSAVSRWFSGEIIESPRIETAIQQLLEQKVAA